MKMKNINYYNAWNIDMEMPTINNIKCPNGTRKKLISTIETTVDHSQRQKFGLDSPTEIALRRFIVGSFNNRYKLGEVDIGINKKRKDHEITYKTDLVNKDGVNISVGLVANFERDYNKKMWVLNFFGVPAKVGSPTKEFDKYVDINWETALKELASLAAPENWESKDPGYGEKAVLKQYLQLTFYKGRLDEEGDGKYFKLNEAGDAVFNTGLVNSDYEDIYCYLEKTKTGNKAWKLAGFAVLGYSSEGKQLLRKFAEPFPKPVQYITATNYHKTYLNTDRNIYIDFDHILDDKFERLPMEFIKRTLPHDRKLLTMIAEYEVSRKHKQLLEIKAKALNNENRKLLVKALNNAKAIAVKRCQANFKTAVSMYYPRQNNISLLLPLKLLHETKGADVALVISETKECSGYQGETLLTLGMAYANARLISKLGSDWL